MISWIITGILALLVARIIWIEVKCGRKFKTTLISTNEQIEEIKQSATMHYRARFGRDPTDTFKTVEPHVAGTAKK